MNSENRENDPLALYNDAAADLPSPIEGKVRSVAEALLRCDSDLSSEFESYEELLRGGDQSPPGSDEMIDVSFRIPKGEFVELAATIDEEISGANNPLQFSMLGRVALRLILSNPEALNESIGIDHDKMEEAAASGSEKMEQELAERLEEEFGMDAEVSITELGPEDLPDGISFDELFAMMQKETSAEPDIDPEEFDGTDIDIGSDGGDDDE